MMRRLLSLLLVVLGAGPAAAQGGVSVYAPVAPKYQLGDFDYVAPSTDGWRQVTSEASMFILVYAEVLDSGQLNTRAQVNAEAHAVPASAAEGRDTLWLTEQGQAQQVKERGDKLVAFSKIAPLEANPAVMTYSLVTKIGDEEMFETFYVILAPDKKSYLVAKLTTKDVDFRTQSYFSQLESSLASLRHAPRAPGAPAPPPSAALPEGSTPPAPL